MRHERFLGIWDAPICVADQLAARELGRVSYICTFGATTIFILATSIPLEDLNRSTVRRSIEYIPNGLADSASRYEGDEPTESRRAQQRQQKKKLRGWLAYAFASEVFAVCSLTLFLPICLEQFARDNGFLLPDRLQPCSAAIPLANGPGPEARCVVKLGWAWIDSASFSLYVYSTSVAVQALTVISMGSIADHPLQRKRILLGFAVLGSISAILFLILPSESPFWPLCAVLAIVSNVSFGASIVALNAYLPSLAKGTEKAIEARREVERTRLNATHETAEIEDITDPEVPLTLNSTYQIAVESYNATVSRETARLSSQGVALGYGSGIAMLIVSLIPVVTLKGSTLSLRMAIGFSGMWWGFFTLPAALWLPSGKSSTRGISSRSSEDWIEGIREAWRKLLTMISPSEMRRLRNTFIYLSAWFLLSDGFTTITSTAVLFAKTSLSMPPSSLIIVGILTPTAGILGSLIWPSIQRKYQWTNLRVLSILVGLASIVPLYGCLGFLSIFQGHFGGLTTHGEMYVLAVLFGFIYGAFQSYARAVFAELIPPGEEARWYGLFSITDKSSSFLGPLAVGVIADATSNIRYAFFFLVVMMWLSMPLLWIVDITKGREDAEAYSIKLLDRDLDH